MDLDGTFHDFGIHRVAGSEAQVTHASARAIKPRRAVGSAALPNLVWLAVGVACLASGAGLCLANRRRRPG
jgi:hypothetical protein